MTLLLRVELVFHAGCPNVPAARAVLAQALQEAGVPAVWTEWCTDDPGCPENRRGLGSPTILVNGVDVAPEPENPAQPGWSGRARCRIYRDGERVAGTPPPALVTEAILKALGPEAS